MNCERFEIMASDLARNELLDAGERRSALTHIEECDHCAQSWNEQRELSDRLRIAAKQMNSLQAPEYLEERLRAAFHDRTGVRVKRPAPQYWHYWVSAVAAALLIFFGLLIWRVRVPTIPQRSFAANSQSGPAVSPQSFRPEPQSVSVKTDIQNGDEHRVPKAKVARHKLQKSQRGRDYNDVAARQLKKNSASNSPANTEAKEVTTDFVALGYGSALDLQDGGQLVRVELPRSALSRFGLPMNMDRVDERVKADVLIGADGLARAIRFVK